MDGERYSRNGERDKEGILIQLRIKNEKLGIKNLKNSIGSDIIRKMARKK